MGKTLKRKTEEELNSCKYVANFLKKQHNNITDVDIPEYEDDEFDINFSANTKFGIKGFSAEVKRVNKYYTDTINVFTDIASANTRFWISSTYDKEEYTQDEILNNTQDTIPQSLIGKQIYMLNASQNLYNGNQRITGKCKWNDIVNSPKPVYVVYLYKNAMLVYNPKQLFNAFLGLYWYNTAFVNQTTAIHYKQGSGWQRKAMIDLSQATKYNITLSQEELDTLFKPITKNYNTQK